MLDLLIRNGRVVTPEGVGQWDVAVQGERIAGLAAPGTLAAEATRVVDASGKIVIPGGIDPHMHLSSIVPRSDGTADTGGSPSQVSRAALYGGTTTLVDFAVVRPGETSIPYAIERQDEAWRSGYCDYAYHVHLQGEVPFEVIAQIPEAISAGYPSMKVFTTDVKPSRHGRMVPAGYIWAIMEQTARHGGVLAVHGEDDEIVRYMYAKLQHEGKSGFENMPVVHNSLSEDLSFRRVIRMSQHLEGAVVYLMHVSAKTGVDAIAEGRAAGYPIYGETLHNYMCFDSSYYLRPNGVIYHTYPSLKTKDDNARLWSGIVDGALSTVATDEVCTTRAIKTEMLQCYNATGGHVGVETRVAVLYSEGVVKRGLSLERFAAVTSTNAAKILGLYPQKGAIAPGSDADLVIIDPEVRKTIGLQDLHDSDYSVWEGWDVQGWPEMTILRGEVVVEGGEFKARRGNVRCPKRKVSPSILSGPWA